MDEEFAIIVFLVVIIVAYMFYMMSLGQKKQSRMPRQRQQPQYQMRQPQRMTVQRQQPMKGINMEQMLTKSAGQTVQDTQTAYVQENRLLYPGQATITIDTVQPGVKNAGLLHMRMWQPSTAIGGQSSYESSYIATDAPSLQNMTA